MRHSKLKSRLKCMFTLDLDWCCRSCDRLILHYITGFRCFFLSHMNGCMLVQKSCTWLGSPLLDESWSILWMFASAQLPAHLKEKQNTPESWLIKLILNLKQNYITHHNKSQFFFILTVHFDQNIYVYFLEIYTEYVLTNISIFSYWLYNIKWTAK